MEYVFSVTYSCYQEKLRIMLNGRQHLSASSAVMKYMNAPLHTYAEKLPELLYQEIEEDYTLLFTGRREEAEAISTWAERNPHCVRFAHVLPPQAQPLPERMIALSRMIRDGQVPALAPRCIRTVFFGRRTLLLQRQAEIESLQIRNQYIRVTFSMSETDESEADVFILLAESLAELAELRGRMGRRSLSFCLIPGQRTGLVQLYEGLYVFAFAPGEFCDAVFRCFIQYPLVQAFAESVRSAVKAVPSEEVQQQLCSLLLEKPMVRLSVPQRVEVGTSVPLQIRMIPEGASVPELLFRYQLPDVVNCSQQWLYGLKKGSVRIQVFEKGETDLVADLSVEVYERNRIRVITLSEYSLLMGCGDTYTLSMSYEPQDADNTDKIRWYSENDAVATVQNGRIRAERPGHCTIWCAAESEAVCCRVEVKPYLHTLELPQEMTGEEPFVMHPGDKFPMQVHTLPADAYDGKLKINSSNLMVVNVMARELRAVSCGQAVITVESAAGRLRRQCSIIVDNPQPEPKKKSFFGLFRKKEE